VVARRVGSPGAFRELLSGSDVSIVNLEGPASINFVHRTDGYVFQVDPALLAGLKYAGIDAVSLANNHIRNAGNEGVTESCSVLESLGVGHAGAGVDAASASAPAALSAGGLKIAFLAFDAQQPENWVGPGRAGAAPLAMPAVVADIRAARADRDRAAAALEAARAGAATVDIRAQEVRVAEASVREAQANVKRLETQVAELQVFAPLDATVLTKAVEAGEVVAAGKPLVLLGDLDHPWIKVYVPETVLGKIKLGTAARVFVDSFPRQPFQGTVSWVSDQAEFTPKNVQTAEERVNLVYAVKVIIQNAKRELKAGMPADAELLIGAGAK
jgi:hypothetical protein